MVELKVPALEKLLDYAASGIGAIAGPMLLPWKAHWEAKARRIAAHSDAEEGSIRARSESESLTMIATAQAEARRYILPTGVEVSGSAEITDYHVAQRIEYQEKKRSANTRDVVIESAMILGDKEVIDHEPDPDWVASFFDHIKDIHSEDLQTIWARILAGEIEQPGRTSLRTLSVLKSMTQSEALLFHSVMQYRIDDLILGKFYEEDTGSNWASKFLALSNIGVVATPSQITRNIVLNGDGILGMEHNKHLLIIEGPPNSRLDTSRTQHALLNPQGKELAEFCTHEQPMMQYLKIFSGWVESHGCTLKIAPITAISEEKFHYDEDAIRLISPKM